MKYNTIIIGGGLSGLILYASITMAAIMLMPGLFIAQHLEVEGQAKITDIPPNDTTDQIVVWQADGTLAVRAASTLKELPQSPDPGDMLYWDGTNWGIVSPPAGNSWFLGFMNGVPTWIPIIGPTDVYNPITNKVWMDRNLGASQVATSSTDAAAYGDLYQWGRAAEGHQTRTSGTTATNATTATPSAGNPWDGLFITEPSPPHDWLTPQVDTLWQGVHGINNPCPAGYRLPTPAEWDAERLSWSSNDAAGAFSSPLKLPLAGFRDVLGSLDFVGTNGHYWSSTVNGTNARYLQFNSSNAFMGSFLRASGYSVRCLKD